MSANPLTVKQKNFKDLIEKAQESMAKVLPKHLDPERMLKVTLLAAMRQPLLYECTRESILRALMTCSELGLEPGDIRGHVYLIPFWNSRAGRYECQVVPGYRGLMSLARRSMAVKSFSAHVIHANDQFQVSYGLDENLIHEPCLNEHPGVAVGAYAVAHLADGSKVFEVMTRSEIEEIAGRSRSKDQQGRLTGPWVTDTEEMWRKTAVRRLCKYLELSPEMVQAFESDEDIEIATAPERGVVNVEGILNPPEPDPPRGLDLDSLRPCLEGALPPERGVEPPPPVFREPVPLPVSRNQPKPAGKARPEAGPLKPKTLSLILSLNNYGITRERIEQLAGYPAEDWGAEVIEVLQNVLPGIKEGGNPERLLQAAFSLEGVSGV